MDLSLFDPTIPVQPEAIDFAPRPKQLDNLKVVLIENTKHNSKELLLKLFGLLEDRYRMQLAGVVRKTSAGHPVSEPDVHTYKKTADIAIAGIGD